MIAQYFAVPDPDQPAVLTYWHRDESGILAPWPKRAKYGPQMPASASRSLQHQLWTMRWRAENFRPWMARVEAAINADPAAAARAFAMATVRCKICGRRLTDPTSRTLGVGPDCRSEAA